MSDLLAMTRRPVPQRGAMVRIFVVGFPRSGTTLLQSLLGAHPALTTFPESHLLSAAARALPFGSLALRKRPQAPLVDDFLQACPDIHLQGSPVAERFRRLDRSSLFIGPAMAEAAIALFDAMAEQRGKEGWLEKTPGHLLFWRLLVKAAPDAQFVHIARRPVDAVASYCSAAQKWERAPRWPLHVALRWNRHLRASIACIGRPRHHFVTYEDLVEAPFATAARLAAAIGLPDAPAFAENYRQVASEVVLPTETHKARAGDEIKARSKTDQYLSRQQRSQVERFVDPRLYARFQQAL